VDVEAEVVEGVLDARDQGRPRLRDEVLDVRPPEMRWKRTSVSDLRRSGIQSLEKGERANSVPGSRMVPVAPASRMAVTAAWDDLTQLETEGPS
jgi:hypothetical protein